MSTKPIAILGAGGFAREVLQVVLDINAKNLNTSVWSPIAFIVEDGFAESESLHGIPVLEGLDHLASQPEVHLVLAIGNSAARYRLASRISEKFKNELAILVHPTAWVGRNVQIGPGSVICAGTQITTDINIGSHVHVNIGSTIGHDAVLGDYATLNPGVNVSGSVTINTGAEIGSNSTVLPGAEIGEWSVVGAGTVVTKSLPSNVTAVGSPAKVIKTRNPGWHETN